MLELVHALHRDPLRIEHFVRDRITRQKLPWDPEARARARKPIEATIALARAAELHAAANDQFGGKA